MVNSTKMFTAAYSVSQTTNGLSVTVTDTSDYTDEPHGSFTSRTLSIQDVYGTEYGPGLWPFASGDAWTFSVPYDLALLILLTLVPASPQPGSTYTKISVATLVNGSMLFAAQIGLEIASNPSIVNQVAYYTNLQRLWTDIENALNMGEFSQQNASQFYLTDIYFLSQNKTTYFG